jgi:hypothetical protein
MVEIIQALNEISIDRIIIGGIILVFTASAVSDFFPIIIKRDYRITEDKPCECTSCTCLPKKPKK